MTQTNVAQLHSDSKCGWTWCWKFKMHFIPHLICSFQFREQAKKDSAKVNEIILSLIAAQPVLNCIKMLPWWQSVARVWVWFRSPVHRQYLVGHTAWQKPTQMFFRPFNPVQKNCHNHFVQVDRHMHRGISTLLFWCLYLEQSSYITLQASKHGVFTALHHVNLWLIFF